MSVASSALTAFVAGVRHLTKSTPLRGVSVEVSLEKRAAATRRLVTGLGLGADAIVDPARVEHVLDDYFALDAVGAESLRERVERKLAASGTLGDLVAAVEHDLVHRYEPVSQLLAVVDLDPLLANPRVREVATTIAHHALVLDALVALMVEDPELSIALRRHLYRAREATGVTLGRIHEMTGLFGVLKVLSIDLCFKELFGVPLGIERFRSMETLPIDGFLSFWSGVALNISEATVTELFGGSYDNAVVGLCLAAARPSAGSLVGANKEICLRYPAGWSSLYETWNLLFMVSHVAAPHLLIAKLLVPSVTSADEDKFIYRRLLALWLTIQSYILVRHRTDAGEVDLALDPAWLEDVKRTWGRINREHAGRFELRRRARARVVG